MGNAIIMPFDPAPCDKKSHSEHQTLFPLFGRVWHETRLSSSNRKTVHARAVHARVGGVKPLSKLGDGSIIFELK